MRRTIAISAALLLALSAFAACGDDDEQAATSDDDSERLADGEPLSASPMPDDVTLTWQPAAIVTWEEADDAFEYRVELDGRTLRTTLSRSYEAVGADTDGEFVVEAVDIDGESLGPAPGVQVTAAERLVVEWTEEDQGVYYVQYSSPGGGQPSVMASSPFVIADLDEVTSVAFGPAVLVRVDEVNKTTAPFEYGDEFYVELPVP